MKVVGKWLNLLDYYNSHYGVLTEDDVTDTQQSYDKQFRTRYTGLYALKDNKEISIEHQKCTLWGEEGEFIIVKEDNNTIDKVNVDDFFDDDKPNDIDDLKKLLNIK